MYITLIFFLCAVYYIFCARHRAYATADNIKDTNNLESNQNTTMESQYVEKDFTPAQIIDLTFAADTSY